MFDGATGGLNAEERAVYETVREFAVERLRPEAGDRDREERFPEEAWDALADLDLTGLTTPQAYDGYEADRLTYALVNEALAYGSLSVATALSVHCLATSCIAEFGTDEQRERWLPEMAEGRPVGMFALSEPGAGSNPAEMETRARRDGDGYVIDGEKQWITNGRRGGVCILFAKVDGGVTQFLVPADSDGFEPGEREDKLGLRASDTTGLRLDGVRVPAANRLTEPGRGLAAALHVLTGGRIGIAAQATGVAQAAVDAAVEYAGEREQFGESIGQKGAIRQTLGDCAARVQAARTLVRSAARRADAGEDVRVAAAMAKYLAGETAVDVCGEAIQVHGGYGYTTEYPVERLYRDAKITTIYEGTSEIQKEVIARGLLDE